ncbi:MAG: DUF3794 domain-containing protein [Pelosinus sp.]|nr:DUF3794 domain-containing protein [Pelosinus sp.]
MSDDLRQSSGSTSSSTTATFSVAGTGTTQTAEVVCGCPEPGPEKIQVEQVLGAEMAQRVVEFDMVVPAQKPDIEQVIDVYVKDVEITSVDVIPDKVIVRGVLEVKVMYVANLPDQPVHAFEKGNIRFTRDIVIEGAEKGMDATADVTVEYVNYDFDEDEPRTVHITIVLKVWTRVTSTAEMDVYALTPVDQVGQIEVVSASTSAGDSSVASTNADDIVSASHFAGYGVQNVLVTGPGVTPTVGTQAVVSGTATITGDNVNVRSGPGTNFPVVIKVNKGTQVTIKEQAFGWYKVILSDGVTIGWVASWLVNTGTAPTTAQG